MKKTVALTLALLLGTNIAVAADFSSFLSKYGFFQHVVGQKKALPRGFDRLNLSEQQKARIYAIVEADRREYEEHQHANHRQQSFQQRMQTRKEQERRLLSSKQFDEKTARQMIAERQQERLSVQRGHAERELRMLKKRHAIFQVLTPAQQKQYQQIMESGTGS